MNKRVMKVIEKLQTGNKKVVAFRRDQLKKAIDENAFDSMKTYDYDELENAGRKTILNPTLKDIEISWLENGDIWARMENNTLEVVVKYGYSTRRFYFDTMKEYKEEYNNIDLEASPEDDELLKAEVIEEVKTVQPVAETPQPVTTKETIKAAIKNLYNGMFTPAERKFILDMFKMNNNIGSVLNIEKFYNEHFEAYKNFVNHAKAVYNKYGTLTKDLLNTPLVVEPVQEQPQQENNKVVNLFDYKSKKAAKQEIKQPKKNNKINLCVCGSILKGEEENKIGICNHCIEYVYSMYLDGTLKARDEKLYNMIHEAMTE